MSDAEDIIANRNTESPEAVSPEGQESSTPTPQIESSDSPDPPHSGSPEPLLEKDVAATDEDAGTVVANPVLDKGVEEDALPSKKEVDFDSNGVPASEIVIKETAVELEEAAPKR